MSIAENTTEPFLVFGYFEKDNLPACVAYANGANAIDRYYFTDLMKEIVDLRHHSTNHPIDPHFPRLATLFASLNANTFYELNSRLFSSIDKLGRHVAKTNMQQLTYVGVDYWELNRSTAPLLHPDKDLSIHASWMAAPPPSTNSICLSRWSAALFSSTTEYAEWVSRFGASENTLWFSTNNKEWSFDFLGQPHLLMSYPHFRSIVEENGQVVCINSIQQVDLNQIPLIEVQLTCVCRSLITERNSAELAAQLGLSNRAPDSLDAVSPEYSLPPVKHGVIRTNRLNSFQTPEDTVDMA